jgi:hypothetical protein
MLRFREFPLRLRGQSLGLGAQVRDQFGERIPDVVDPFQHGCCRLRSSVSDLLSVILCFLTDLSRPLLGTIDDRAHVLRDDGSGAIGRLNDLKAVSVQFFRHLIPWI